MTQIGGGFLILLMPAILIAIILLCGLPVWLPFRARVWVSAAQGAAIAAYAANTLLQIVFVVLVGMGAITLDRSARFAVVGAPLCAFAMGVALMPAYWQRPNPLMTGRIVSSAGLGMFLWLILITLH